MSRSSSRISTIVRSFIQWRLLRWGFQAGSWLAPKYSVLRAASLFCTPYPGSQRRALAAPVGAARLDTVQIGDELVPRYIWGDPTLQPYVLFAHGWSSHGARILPWVEPLRAAGYAVVAFDQLAHGRSSGSQSNLVEFTGRLLAAAGLALARGLQADCAVLVAPAADPVDAGRRFARQVGLAEHLRRRMFELFEARLSIRFDELQAERNAPLINRPALVVHDLEDREVPWCEGERWARYWHRARLLSTRGLGHHRILDDPNVIAAALAFLQGRAVGERLVSSPDLAYGVA